MNCDRIRQDLTAQMAGELFETQAEALRRHRQDCPSCQAFWAELESLERVADLWEEVEPTPTFEARVWTAVQAQARRPRRRASWLYRYIAPLLAARPLATAALLTVAAGLSLCVATLSPPSPDRTTNPNGIEEANIMEVHTIIEEEDQLKDFDVIAHLELLDHLDEVKNQLFKPESVPQRTN